MKQAMRMVGVAWLLGLSGTTMGCASTEDDSATTTGALSRDDADREQGAKVERSALKKGDTFSMAIGSAKAIRVFRASDGLWGIEPKDAPPKNGFRSIVEYGIRRGEFEPNVISGDEQEAAETDPRCFVSAEAEANKTPRIPGVLNFRIVWIHKKDGWASAFGATAYNSADNVTWLLDCSMRGGRESEVPVRELKSLLAWRLAIDESSDE
jgi:hypothetical protein